MYLTALEIQAIYHLGCNIGSGMGGNLYLMPDGNIYGSNYLAEGVNPKFKWGDALKTFNPADCLEDGTGQLQIEKILPLIREWLLP